MALSKPDATNVHYKTGSLQKTDNYIWNTADTLGIGATSVVYFGRNRSTGDICAVKVFHDRGHSHLHRIQSREIQTLRSLNHPNLVKLLAIETEQSTANTIIVTEYCSGGSVHNMLEQPQYGFGFPEEEFVLFLIHVSLGFKYLKSLGFVHRDIKPGNILRCIGSDGVSVYKISDFGSARELPEEDEFMSIYGTEEYLDPRMFQRAVLKEHSPVNRAFDSSVDLWSLGVTIYHVCTGTLPFKPFEGRDNAALMFQITSQKPEGVISGVQKIKNGEIVWGRTLPETCRLSRYLQEITVNILAGIMETNPHKRWTESKFFSAVEEERNKITLNIFNYACAENILLYLNKSDSLVHIQEQIAKWTDISREHQLLLWQEKPLSTFVMASDHIEIYPRQILKGQIFLYKTQLDTNLPLQPIGLEIPDFQDVLAVVDVDKDAKVAKKSSAVAAYIMTSVTLVIQRQDLLGQSDMYFRSYLKTTVIQFRQRVPDLKRAIGETRFSYEIFCQSYEFLIKCSTKLVKLNSKYASYNVIHQKIASLEIIVGDNSLKDLLSKVENRLEEIDVYINVLYEKILEQERNAILVCVGCQEDDHCVSKVENLKDKVVGIASIMLKHKKYRTLHQHEEFIHQTEKQKMQEYCGMIQSIFHDHCRNNFRQAFKGTMKQFGIMVRHRLRTTKVEQNMQAVTDCHDQLSQRLRLVEAECRGIVTNVLDLIDKSEHSSSSVSFTSPPNVSTTQTIHIKSIASSPQSESKRSFLLTNLSSSLQNLETENRKLKSLMEDSTELLKRILQETSNLSIEETRSFHDSE